MKPMHAFDKGTVPMLPSSFSAAFRGLALGLLLALPAASAAPAQKTFATPEAAVEAFLGALKANDQAGLLAIMGEAHKDLVVTDDPSFDAATRAQAAAQLEAFRFLAERGEDRRVLLMGTEAWPLPIPLVREGKVWRFATEEGVEELINRRIGGDERQALFVLRAYLGAQRAYASEDRDGDGVLQFAQRLASTPGKHDGLYWPADAAQGEEESPFGPMIAESSQRLAGKAPEDSYQGYHFRILTSQGANAPGGAYSYVIHGRMVAGFAMVAFPAEYGKTGVMTFIVNQNGTIYEKDLGAQSTSLGAKMRVFNPGPGWKPVAP